MNKTEIKKLLKELEACVDKENPNELYYTKRKEEIENIIMNLSQPLEAEVKPACEMERPTLENFLPKGTTIRAITNMFLANPTLYAYINTLDEYIDKLESKSV